MRTHLLEQARFMVSQLLLDVDWRGVCTGNPSRFCSRVLRPQGRGNRGPDAYSAPAMTRVREARLREPAKFLKALVEL